MDIAVYSTPLPSPSAAILSENSGRSSKPGRERFIGFRLHDDHADPFYSLRELAVVDTSDREPQDGRLFGTITDRGRFIIVMARKVGNRWFCRAPNRRKVVGPMEAAFFRSKIVGKVGAASFWDEGFAS